MQRTFCDVCNDETGSFTARLYGSIAHRTSQGEDVGCDDITSRELCQKCYDIAKKVLGLTSTARDFDRQPCADRDSGSPMLDWERNIIARHHP